MKVFAVSDLHMRGCDYRLDVLREAVAKEQPDVIVDAGDHTYFGTGGAEWRAFLQEQTEARTVLMVSGNHEAHPMTRDLCAQDCPGVIQLADRDGGVVVGGIHFVGCDSYYFLHETLPGRQQDIMLFGSMNWDESKERRALLAEAARIERAARRAAGAAAAKHVVLVSHYPPVRLASCEDYRRTFGEEMEGSVCEIAEHLCRTLHAAYCIHGHFHLRRGMQQLYRVGGLPLINPGPEGYHLSL